MSDQINNTLESLQGIDKFDGSFDQEELGCTIFVNETVNSIKDLAAGGLYAYLICRPKDWKLNVKHLTTLFDCSKDKIYRLIDVLISLNLLTRTEIRNKGKFLHYHYRIHLRKKITQSVQKPPRPEKPDTVKPDTVFPDAYKTNILPLQNKEITTTTTETKPVVVVVNDFSKSLTEHEQSLLAICYENNPFETTNIKNGDDFLRAALYSLLNRDMNITRQQRLHGIIKLVKHRSFAEPIGWVSQITKTQKIPEDYDFKKYANNVKGYEWVGEWIKDQLKNDRLEQTFFQQYAANKPGYEWVGEWINSKESKCMPK